MNHLQLIDGLYDDQTCRDIINIFTENHFRLKTRYGKAPLSYLTVVRAEDHLKDGCFPQQYLEPLIGLAPPGMAIQRVQIEERLPGGSMPFHTDEADQSTGWTTVVYLNDVFDGGATIVRPEGHPNDRHDTLIWPRVGRAISFNGKTQLHAVTPVEEAARYTLAAWYYAL